MTQTSALQPHSQPPAPPDGRFTPTDGDMQLRHYGILVSDVGEDGEMLALGHHDPRYVLAAFNRHARVVWALPNLADNRAATISDILPNLKQEWALFRRPSPAEGEDPEYEWYVRFTGTPDTPGAVPVTTLST